MTRKFWNWVRNEEPDSFGSDRTLYLDGEISDETWFGDEVTPKLFSDELYAGDGNITLWRVFVKTKIVRSCQLAIGTASHE